MVFQQFELCTYLRVCFSWRGAVIDTEPGEGGTQLFELCTYLRVCFSGRGAVIDTEPGEGGISTIRSMYLSPCLFQWEGCRHRP